MYKKVSGNLQRWRREGGPKLPVPERGNKNKQSYSPKVGVVVRWTRGQQEIRLIGLYAHEGSLYLGGLSLAQGAKPGDRVRLYYNGRLGLWCGIKIYPPVERDKTLRQEKI